MPLWSEPLPMLIAFHPNFPSTLIMNFSPLTSVLVHTVPSAKNDLLLHPALPTPHLKALEF